MKKYSFLVIFFLFLCLDSLSERVRNTRNPFESHCIEDFAISVEGFQNMIKHPSNFTHQCYTTDYRQTSDFYFDNRTYKGSYEGGGDPAPYRTYFADDGSGNKLHHGSFLLKDGTELKGVYYEYLGRWRKGKVDGGGILVFPNGSHYVGYFKNGKFNGPGYFTIDSSKFDEEEPFLYDQYDRLMNQGQYSKKSKNSKQSKIEKKLFGVESWKPICDYSVDSAKWDNCIAKKYLFKPDVLENISDKTAERQAEYIENHKACNSAINPLSGKGRTGSPKCLIEVDIGFPGGSIVNYIGNFKNNMPTEFRSIMIEKKSKTIRKYNKYILCFKGTLNKYGFLEGQNSCFVQGETIKEYIVGYFTNGKPSGILNAYIATSSNKHLPLRERQPVYVGEYDTDFNRALGKSYNQNGKVEYDGEWGSDNKPHGYGEFFYNDGTKYKGGFKNGKKHGKGTFTYLNGKMTTGRYEDDRKVGRHIEINY